MSSSNSHIFHLREEPSEKYSKPTEVMLKTNTDSDSVSDGNAGIHHTPGLTPLAHLGVHASTFSPYASSEHVRNFAVNPSLPYYINTRRSTSDNSSSKAWQLEDLKRGNHSAPLRGYLTAAKPSPAYSDEGNDTRESLHEKNLWKNFGQPSAMIPESSPGLHVRIAVGHETNGCMKMPNPRNDDIISEMLTLGASTNLPNSSFPVQYETLLQTLKKDIGSPTHTQGGSHTGGGRSCGSCRDANHGGFGVREYAGY